MSARNCSPVKRPPRNDVLGSSVPITVADSLAWAAERLGAPSGSPRADAQLLLAHALGTGRDWLIAHADACVDPLAGARFESYVRRRSGGEPVAYILQTAWFYGREFVVNAAVLVPRPETEHLIDEALAHVGGARDKPPTFLDIGLGSGAIGCTLAAELPSARVTGTEISPEALEIARENARQLAVASRCGFLLGDLATPVRGRRFDAILANLPYVETAQIAAAPDPVSFEPRLALDGGADGLDLYRRLLPELPALLEPGGLVLLEAAPASMAALAALASDAFPGGTVSIGWDYAGHERFVRVREA